MNERELLHLDFIICAISRRVTRGNPLSFFFLLQMYFCNNFLYKPSVVASFEADALRVIQTVSLKRCFDRRVAQSVYCLVTGWTTGRSRFDPRQRQRIFPLTSVSRPALGPTQPLAFGSRDGQGVSVYECKCTDILILVYCLYNLIFSVPVTKVWIISKISTRGSRELFGTTCSISPEVLLSHSEE
jgi:hypothetical protein